MLPVDLASRLKLRRARTEDRERMFEWANDPVVRSNALCTESIPWDRHNRWFAVKMNDGNCLIFIAELQEIPVGQVRIDIDGKGDVAKGIIDISIDRTHRGKGIGPAIMKHAVNIISRDRGICFFLAQVKKENVRSTKLFIKAGFRKRQASDNTAYHTFELTVK